MPTATPAEVLEELNKAKKATEAVLQAICGAIDDVTSPNEAIAHIDEAGPAISATQVHLWLAKTKLP